METNHLQYIGHVKSHMTQPNGSWNWIQDDDDSHLSLMHVNFHNLFMHVCMFYPHGESWEAYNPWWNILLLYIENWVSTNQSTDQSMILGVFASCAIHGRFSITVTAFCQHKYVFYNQQLLSGNHKLTTQMTRGWVYTRKNAISTCFCALYNLAAVWLPVSTMCLHNFHRCSCACFSIWLHWLRLHEMNQDMQYLEISIPLFCTH